MTDADMYRRLGQAAGNYLQCPTLYWITNRLPPTPGDGLGGVDQKWSGEQVLGVAVPSAWELGTKMRVWDALRGYRPWRRHGRAGIHSELDKARAERLIRDLFRRLEERGGDVDRWETEHTLSALGRYMASEYGKAAEHIDLAGIPAARRNAKAVSKLERAYGDRFQPDLRTLEAIFADLVKRQGEHPN